MSTATASFGTATSTNRHFCHFTRSGSKKIKNGFVNVFLKNGAFFDRQAQITMSFRRANAEDAAEDQTNRPSGVSQAAATAAGDSASFSTSTASATFGGVNVSQPTSISFHVTPDGVTVSQAQSASFTVPVQPQDTTSGGINQLAGDSAASGQPTANPQQQPASFFQQLMQGVANAGVILGKISAGSAG